MKFFPRDAVVEALDRLNTGSTLQIFTYAQKCPLRTLAPYTDHDVLNFSSVDEPGVDGDDR